MFKKLIIPAIFFIIAPVVFSQTYITTREENTSTLSYPGPVTFLNIHSTDVDGGALYTNGTGDAFRATTTFNDNVTFTTNSTNGLGGAVYIGQYGDVILNGTGVNLFTANEDSTGDNDVYIKSGGTLTTASSGSYTFKGGIAGEALARISHTGTGVFDAVLTNYFGNYIQNGNGSSIIRGDTAAKFSIQNGTADFKGSLLNGSSLANNGQVTFSGTDAHIRI